MNQIGIEGNYKTVSFDNFRHTLDERDGESHGFCGFAVFSGILWTPGATLCRSSFWRKDFRRGDGVRFKRGDRPLRNAFCDPVKLSRKSRGGNHGMTKLS